MLRAFELVHLSLSDGSIERQSMFAYARKQAVGGGTAAYDVEEWENQRVAEGSATVALTMAAELSDVRLSTPVSRIAIVPQRLRRHDVATARSSAPTRWCSPCPPDLRATSTSPASATSG